MRRVLAGVFVALAVAAAVGLGLLRGGERSSAPEDSSKRGPEATASPEGDPGPPGGLAVRSPASPSDEDPPPLYEAGTVHGVVVNADGKPVPQALVRLYREDAPKERYGEDPTDEEDALVTIRGWQTWTDEHGRYRLRGLKPGTAWVQAGGFPHTPVAARAEVGGPAVRLTLDPYHAITVKVLGPEGRPAWRAYVEVVSGRPDLERPPNRQKPGGDWLPLLTWPERRPCRADTGRDGTALVEVRTPPYRVTVTPPVEWGVLPPPPVTVEGDTVTIRLLEGRMLSGVLRDAEGEPVSSAFVWWRTPGGTWSSKRAGSGGEYAIGGLPEGAVELWADVFGRDPSRAAKPLVSESGREDVDVLVDVGHELRVRIENWPAGVEGDAVLKDRTETFGRLSVSPARVSGSGEAVFRRLQRDHRYALRVFTDDGTLAAVRDDATANGDAIRVRLSAVAPLRLALEGDGSFRVANVSVADFDFDWADVEGAPAKEIRVADLPTGRFPVEVVARTPTGDLLRGVLDADVPGRVSLRLEKVQDTR